MMNFKMEHRASKGKEHANSKRPGKTPDEMWYDSKKPTIVTQSM